MNRCPITYEACGNKLYSEKGLHLLSKNLNDLKPFPYSIEEQIQEAITRASKIVDSRCPAKAKYTLKY